MRDQMLYHVAQEKTVKGKQDRQKNKIKKYQQPENKGLKYKAKIKKEPGNCPTCNKKYKDM